MWMKDRIREDINAIIALATTEGRESSDVDHTLGKNLRKAKKFTSKLFGLFDKKVEIVEFPLSNTNISAIYQVKRGGVYQDISREDIFPGDIIRMNIEQLFPCDCVAYNNSAQNLDEYYTFHVNMDSPTVLKVSDIHKTLTPNASENVPIFYRGDAYYGIAKTEKAFGYVYSKIALDSRLAEYTQSEIDVLKDRAAALPHKDNWTEEEMKLDGMAIFIKTVSKEMAQKKENFDKSIKESSEFLDFIAVATGQNCRQESMRLHVESNQKSLFRFCKAETVYI